MHLSEILPLYKNIPDLNHERNKTRFTVTFSYQSYIKKSLFRVCSLDACDKPEDEVRDGRGADVLEDVRHELLLLEELENLETGKLVAVPILYSENIEKRER